SLKLLKIQAKALALPLIVQKSKSIKEKELDDLEKLLRKVKHKVNYIVSGGVASRYQYERVKVLIEKLGFKLFCPLWQIKAENIWQECLKNNFKIILTKICCEGINKEWLGKVIDKEKLEKLKSLSKKYGFSLEFEGGDAETSVLFMPLFSKEIEIKSEIKSEGNYRHFLMIKETKLKNKLS
ncbi:MAG: diphthine--ammonia ligase, partial [Candidatus Nanoarchaeia archaeon]